MPTCSDVACPGSVDELAAVMADAARHRRTVAVRGRGTKRQWGPVVAPTDLVVDVSGLDRVVDHADGDLVVTAEAGVALQDLQLRLRSARQWLALDPPESDGSLGGIVATASSGPRRLRYGTPRDLLIGVTVVLADGTVAHSGGKVVKNVAGYDLGKLFTGSFGTLGVIAQCTFRLHPTASACRVVAAKTDRPGDTARRILRSGVVPSAIEWDGGRLTVVIESIETAAVAEADRVAALVGGDVTDRLPEGFGARPWNDVRPVGLKVTHRVGATDEVLRLLADRLPTPRLAAHAGAGVVWAAYDGDGSPVDGLRETLAGHDGQVVVVVAPDAVKQRLDMWGPVRGLPIMRRIKDQFDPDHRMAPGSFVKGIGS